MEAFVKEYTWGHVQRYIYVEAFVKEYTWGHVYGYICGSIGKEIYFVTCVRIYIYLTYGRMGVLLKKRNCN